MEVEQPTRGVLTSPNYPGHYPNNLNLVQKIQVPEGNTIQIIFTHFSLGERIDDFVRIQDQDSTILAWYYERPGFSEDDWGKVIFSNTNTVEVLFVTDESVARGCWRLAWGESEINLDCM